ncbi:MAG: sulfotransferase [Deltaproteobacteria bacterium]|nr:MAG: sulfotransferase [Deltaproteobacteria bacterium]
MGSTPGAFARRLEAAASWRLARLRKHLWQRIHLRRPADKTALFVVGCHRSGTTMLASVMDRSPRSWVYHEGSRRAFHDYRLRAPEVVERRIADSRASTVVFKPICDAQWTDRILDRHPGSRAIWIYRRYADVVNSAVVKWGDHQKDIMRWIRDEDAERLGWRGERLSDENRDLVKRLYRAQMSPADGAALFWYLRNALFFELGLDRDPRVLTVRYEDLVTNPESEIERVYAHAGCRFEPAFAAGVFASSVGRTPSPPLEAEIRSLCDAMTSRLDAAHRSRPGRPPA